LRGCLGAFWCCIGSQFLPPCGYMSCKHAPTPVGAPAYTLPLPRTCWWALQQVLLSHGRHSLLQNVHMNGTELLAPSLLVYFQHDKYMIVTYLGRALVGGGQWANTQALQFVCCDRSTSGSKTLCTRLQKLAPCIVWDEEAYCPETAADSGVYVLSAHSINSSSCCGWSTTS
jgi:hypothetical protein